MVKAEGAKEKAKAKGASPVDAYLAALPAPQRGALERLRGIIRKAAPDATETIGYGIPTYKHAGKNLVHFAAFKEHCSFFPGSGAVTGLLARDLAGFETKKGTVRFTLDKPLPAALVTRIVRMRVAQNDALAAKRAPAKRAPRGSAKAAKAAPQRRRAPKASAKGAKAAKAPPRRR